MAVVIWTSSNKATYLRRVCEPVFGATKTVHRVVPLHGNRIPEIYEGDVLVAMGGACLDIIKQYGAVPKNRTIGSLRQKMYDFPPGKLLLSYDPGIIEVDTGREPEIIYDLQLACRLHDLGMLIPKVGTYKYVNNFNTVLKQIKKAYSKGKPVYVAGDLETIGFDPFHRSDVPWHLDEGEEEPEGYYPDARIISISFTVVEGTAYVYQVPEEGIDPNVRDQIELILTSSKVKITGANWKFDCGWIHKHWNITCTNQRFDTGIVGCLLDENRSNSLNLHAKIYASELGGYDDNFNQNHDKSRMDLALKEDPDGFLTYAGGDTDACLRVTNKMRPQLLKDKKLTYFYMNLLQPASPVFAKLEQRGVYVDVEQYDKLQEQCTEEMIDFHNNGLKLMSRKLRLKFEAEPIKTMDDKLSLTRPTLIKEFLFTKRGLNLKPTMFSEKAKEDTWEYASTAAEHLETFAKNEDAAQFIKCYSGFNGAKKTLSTYIIGFRKHLRSDGMFHPSYNLYKGDFGGRGDDSGTVTGRLSTRDPAYQTIPKFTKWASPLRTVYVAPPGMAILKLDYSQGELRVAACVAHEEHMIAAYKSGIDMHLKTGAEVYGITLKKALKWKNKGDDRVKAVRQGGKAGNFGLLYAMSPTGFVNYAWNTYGVELSIEEAKAFHNAFFEMYPGLVAWHEKYKALARRYLIVRNPLGRIRHLPLINSRNYKARGSAERQSINSPIQSCLSDMMLLTMVLIDREYPDLHMFGMTHDEFQCYVPVDEVSMWAKRLRDIMENLPFNDFSWEPELDFPAEAEWSITNLAECVELIGG